MAVVNLESGKIVGAKEGSRLWFHELGHIEFAKMDKAITYSYYNWICPRIALVFITADLFFNFLPIKLMALAFVGLMLYYYYYEEIWCWNYSFKKMKELKGGDSYGIQKEESRA